MVQCCQAPLEIAQLRVERLSPPPTGGFKALAEGDVRPVPISSVIFQLFSSNRTKLRFQAKQKEGPCFDVWQRG